MLRQRGQLVGAKRRPRLPCERQRVEHRVGKVHLGLRASVLEKALVERCVVEEDRLRADELRECLNCHPSLRLHRMTCQSNPRQGRAGPGCPLVLVAMLQRLGQVSGPSHLSRSSALVIRAVFISSFDLLRVAWLGLLFILQNCLEARVKCYVFDLRQIRFW